MITLSLINIYRPELGASPPLSAQDTILPDLLNVANNFRCS